MAEVGWLERHQSIERTSPFLGYERAPADNVVGLLVRTTDETHVLAYTAQAAEWALRATLDDAVSVQAGHEQLLESVYEWVRRQNPQQAFAVLRSIGRRSD
jgi:hypothetical protein